MALETRGLSPLLSVYDMPTAVHFYRDLLGFETVNHSPFLSAQADDYHWTLLRRGGIELMLNTAYDEGERPAKPDASLISAHGETVLFFGCPNVDEAFPYLRDKGLAVNKPVVAHYGMKQLSLSDPDGYGLCFQWPA
jgi:glyoxylase I family protein